MIERSKPPERDPAHNRRRSEPNSEEFEKYKRIEKVREVDPEESRKRKQRYRVEEESRPTPEKRTEKREELRSPYETYQKNNRQNLERPRVQSDESRSIDRETRRQYHLPEPRQQRRQENLPRSPNFWNKEGQKKEQRNNNTKQTDAQQTPQKKDSSEKGKSKENSQKGEDGFSFGKDSEKKGSTESVFDHSSQKPHKEGLEDDSTESKGSLHTEKDDLSKSEKEKQKDLTTPGSQLEKTSSSKFSKKSSEKKQEDPKEQKVVFSGEEKQSKLEKTQTGSKRKDNKTDQSSKELDESSESAYTSIGKSGSSNADSGSKKRDSESVLNTGQIQNIPPSIEAQATAASNPLTTYMSPEVATLFSHMVGTMMVMVREGIITTEITLTSDKFQSSVFYGTTIALDKYSTAPDAFNVRIMGSQQAVNLCNANADELMGAFQRGNFGFKVQRFDTSLDTHGGTFKRKPKTGGDTGGSMGKN